MNYLVGFNSTLVQLKGSHLLRAPIPNQGFNSTLVQLKDRSVMKVIMGKYGFNSTLVQLKAKNMELVPQEVLKFQFYLSSIKRSRNWQA